ncbi:hypothetical protein AB0M36_31730 [Actinoplanes sp. NPDC051346]|uniref:hypothetical protein n=1 Tax=Actinoplanes sp. NPDC051346 TaxID=3155048 RepID=UPI00342D98AF
MEPGGFLDRDVRPGQRVGLPLTLRNTGNRPITSTVMWFYREAMYQYPQSFKNCGYGRERIVCRFDDDVPPGATYRLSEPFAVTVRKQVPAPGTIGQSFSWSTPADAQNALEDFGAERPRNGTGSVLRLVPLRGAAPAPTPRQGVPQSTGSIFDPAQSVFFKLTGRNVADLAAIGADARGKRGKTITVKVGAKNLGPAFIFGITKPAAAVVVSRPKGTTVVSVPTGCLPSSKGRVVPKKDPRGAAEYRCATTVNPFEAGKQITWAFKLRIDKKGALTGGVRVVSSTVDGKRTNDSAKLRINPPAKKK